ncbi:hypothetical protein MRX96_046282 [Rhipicephalus microplus]
MNDSSNDELSTTDGVNPAPSPGVELEVSDPETSRRPDTARSFPSVSDEEAGPPWRRRRLDDFPGEWQSRAYNSGRQNPGAHSRTQRLPDNNVSDEDDGDTYPVRGVPLPGWLDFFREVLEDPLEDTDPSSYVKA